MPAARPVFVRGAGKRSWAHTP